MSTKYNHTAVCPCCTAEYDGTKRRMNALAKSLAKRMANAGLNSVDWVRIIQGLDLAARWEHSLANAYHNTGPEARKARREAQRYENLRSKLISRQ